MVAVCLDSVFLSIFGRLPDAVLLADDNRRYVFANPAAAKLLEQPADEIVGRRIDDYVADQQIVDSDWRQFIQAGRGEGSYRLRTKTGRLRYVQFSAVANASAGLHLSVLRDVTAAHEAELQKVQIQHLAELALHAAQMGCWNWSTTTGSTTCNPAFQELFDFKSNIPAPQYEEFLKRVHPDDLPALRNQLSETLRGGERYETQYRVVCHDGSIRWVLDRGEVLFDQDRKRIGMSGVAWDITKQRMLEQERANHVRDLARSNLDLQRFAHVASHDLKEPLRNISALSELLARQSASKLDEDERDVLEMIVSSAKRMAVLIDSMLTYARTGLKRELILTRVAARDIVNDALANLRLAIEQTDAVVNISDLPTISCARSDMAQVFQNLIGNAIKYCETRPHVRINARPGDNEWIFSVLDNGIGINPAHRDEVFDMFTRLHSDTYPGTGAGLAICKAIVEKHGGRIWVESEDGEGSAFFFSLPS